MMVQCVNVLCYSSAEERPFSSLTLSRAKNCYPSSDLWETSSYVRVPYVMLYWGNLCCPAVVFFSHISTRIAQAVAICISRSMHAYVTVICSPRHAAIRCNTTSLKHCFLLKINPPTVRSFRENNLKYFTMPELFYHIFSIKMSKKTSASRI